MQLKTASRLILLVLAFLVPGLVNAQFYNGAQQDYGKNRVQYQDFLWQYYRFDRLETYFYKEGRDIAQFVARSAHKHLKELERDLDIAIDERLQFIVYNSLTDFRQSNIGISGAEQYNIGGVTRIVGTKVFVYFEGDHQALDRQVRSGVAQVMLDQMMFGGNWREVLRNSTLLNLPEWFTKGLVAHIEGPMDPEQESLWRDGVLNDRFAKFNRLRDGDAIRFGHAVWSYVADVYGESVIPNILYMTRVSRNVESGFLFVLGVRLKDLGNECLLHYKEKYEADERAGQDMTLNELPVRTKRKRAYQQFRISPNGRFAAYVSNEMGQYKVWVHDIAEQRTRKIIKGEKKLNRIVDRTYPVLAWHPSSQALSFIIERKGELFMKTYTLNDRKITTKPVFMLEKVLSMAYSNDGRNIVFSGVREGRTDLYLYYVLGNRQEQLTFDRFDDLDPRFVDDDQAIIFASDRSDDTLRTEGPNVPADLVNGDRDIFIYDLAGRSSLLRRLTYSPRSDERQPYGLDSASYTFLGGSGLQQRFRVVYDSVVSHIDTTVHYRYFAETERLSRYRRSIIEQDVQPEFGRIGQLVYENGRYRFLVGRVSELSAGMDDGPRSEPGAEGKGDQGFNDLGPIGPVVKIDPRLPEVEDEQRVDIRNYQFLDEVGEPSVADGRKEDKELVATPPVVIGQVGAETVAVGEQEFKFPEQRNYNVNFAIDEVLTQVDNSYNLQFYQPFTGAANLNPGLSGFIQMGVSDLFEDHKIVGGFRLALNLNNNDYMLTYINLKRRMDKKITVMRQSLQGLSQLGVLKVHTHTAAYQFSWPFSELASLRSTLMYRHDRYVLQSTDLFSLRASNFTDQMAGIKLEYVYDSSLPLGLNLYTGWKVKFFGEYYVQPDETSSDMQVFGLDLRHSLRIHRDMVLVNRLAGSTSLGSRRVIYFLGGVDNWLFPRVDNSIPIDFSQNYVYQASATPMRGFFYNARNGNSFGVWNTELRLPLFRYLFDRPIRSDFLQSFQLIAFGDAGVAWTGSDPYAENNSFNTQVVDRNPLTITIKNQREPLLFDYGFGVRTRLLGYYVRADWAWGVDDGVIQDPVFHLSLSLDI
ncbi:MAG: PD40 domain-containing protein [Flavobacteriales bacterium]|nr:PD40 domain-containing protein [Flavobacteriales bacterium]